MKTILVVMAALALVALGGCSLNLPGPKVSLTQNETAGAILGGSAGAALGAGTSGLPGGIIGGSIGAAVGIGAGGLADRYFTVKPLKK